MLSGPSIVFVVTNKFDILPATGVLLGDALPQNTRDMSAVTTINLSAWRNINAKPALISYRGRQHNGGRQWYRAVNKPLTCAVCRVKFSAALTNF